MKLLFVLAAILALAVADEEKKEIEAIEDMDDSEAAASASVEILKEGVDLTSAASSYNYVPPSQRPPQWQRPENTWQPEKQPEQPGVQNDYYWSSGTGGSNAPHYHPPTTTTPVPIIKQEQYIGDNGDYHYEYQIGDGTHVGEQGWFSSPKKDEDSIVKKGWYSFVGADGKTYTVTYWADKTGFHAYGDHLPTPPPPPAPAQAPQQVNNQYKPQQNYPTQTAAPLPAQPTKPAYVPTQPAYTPTQKPTIPPQQIYYPPQQTYYPPQQTYYPPQQTYYPQQQNDYPQQQQVNYPQQQNDYPQQQQVNYPQQQVNYPQQQTYYPQQQNNYVPQYNV